MIIPIPGQSWKIEFPEPPSTSNFVKIDNALGDTNTQFTEISVTQWIYMDQRTGGVR